MTIGLPVYKSSFARAFNDDGTPRLFTLCRMYNPPLILVHPDRLDAFYMAINQPDVFAHAEVRELLGFTRRSDGSHP